MRILAFFLTLCLAMPAFSRPAEDPRRELNSTLSAIRASGEKQKELAQKTARLQAELKALQQEMASMGKDTSKQEEDLTSYEEKLSILEDQKQAKAAALKAKQADLSAMISAMVKLGELPPEAVIAMPGKLDETMETARALGIVTRAIEEEAESLKAQLRELDALEEKIHQGRQAVASRKTTLSERQAELAAKIKERGALVDILTGQGREENERIATLTAKSHSLQELVESLQKTDYGREKHAREQNWQRKKNEEKNDHERSFADARGHISMPVAGRIIERYGNRTRGETFSKGIMIETREEAQVVAPFDGKVVFAGPFRDYGRIVIIRHNGDYHTLLSGMEEINCKPGQPLLEGEPIGSMGTGNSTKLYMELREGNKPTDPSFWVKR